MQIDIQIDEKQREPKVVIFTDRMTDEISELVRRIAGENPRVIAGFRDGRAVLLQQEEIVRVYAAQGSVYAAARGGEYAVRMRLYEMEERLDKRSFIRISNSEIVNLKMVKSFDLSISGTICVLLAGGARTYASRRYVPRIRQALGI